MISLAEVVDHLYENHDSMYILPSRKAALVYYPPNDAVMVIRGDYQGDAAHCNRELQKGLDRLIKQEKAWLN